MQGEPYYRGVMSGRNRSVGAILTRLGLSFASMPYGIAVRTRNWLFDRGWKKSHAASIPVVSIGNLTVGGTGKTPAVECVARFFRERDRRVAILSRGYGSEAGRNDEALVLEDNLPDVPHLQGADRVGLAKIAVEELESEIIVLDDGFQHRRLKRDLDIVLIDATEPWGYGRLFPRGLLRERKIGLRRAGIVLLTRCDQVPEEKLNQLRAEVQRIVPNVPIAESVHEPTRLVNSEHEEVELALLAGRPVAAVCGIGNPDAFRQTLEKLGASIEAFSVFPDHHAYTREDVDRLREWARQRTPDAFVVTTQKDLVKLRVPQLGGRPVWAVQIALRLTSGQDAMDRVLEGVIA